VVFRVNAWSALSADELALLRACVSQHAVTTALDACPDGVPLSLRTKLRALWKLAAGDTAWRANLLAVARAHCLNKDSAAGKLLGATRKERRVAAAKLDQSPGVEFKPVRTASIRRVRCRGGMSVVQRQQTALLWLQDNCTRPSNRDVRNKVLIGPRGEPRVKELVRPRTWVSIFPLHV